MFEKCFSSEVTFDLAVTGFTGGFFDRLNFLHASLVKGLSKFSEFVECFLQFDDDGCTVLGFTFSAMSVSRGDVFDAVSRVVGECGFVFVVADRASCSPGVDEVVLVGDTFFVDVVSDTLFV